MQVRINKYREVKQIISRYILFVRLLEILFYFETSGIFPLSQKPQN
jgi:cell division protein FtsB